jgi:hypothetical protein
MARLAQSESIRQDLPRFSIQESWEIQELAAAALAADRFNFQATTEQLKLLAPTAQATSQIVLELESVKDLFHVLLDMFLDNKLTCDSEQLFLAALQAGASQQ